MNIRRLSILLASIVCLSGCAAGGSRPSTSRPLPETVAVLPFEMIAYGRASQDDFGSLLFQAAFYDALDVQIADGHLDVNLQPLAETRRLLEERGISVQESWRLPPAELTEILGVEALVRAQVETTGLSRDGALEEDRALLAKYLSNEEDEFVRDPVPTHDIFVQCSLVRGGDGRLLWTASESWSVGKTLSEDSTVERFLHRLAKRFPHRS